MDHKVVKFNGEDVKITKIRLVDANELFPYVGNAMVKLSFGNFDFFKDLKKDDMDLIQRKMCEYTFKGSKNISLSDLEEFTPGILPLMLNFLEYNFGFFSQAAELWTNIASANGSK